MSAVDRLLLLSPDNTRALRERAQLYEQFGAALPAATDLEKVLQLEPHAPDGSALRAKVAKLLGAGKYVN